MDEKIVVFLNGFLRRFLTIFEGFCTQSRMDKSTKNIVFSILFECNKGSNLLSVQSLRRVERYKGLTKKLVRGLRKRFEIMPIFAIATLDFREKFFQFCRISLYRSIGRRNANKTSQFSQFCRISL